jgi:hypothetical protein
MCVFVEIFVRLYVFWSDRKEEGGREEKEEKVGSE